MNNKKPNKKIKILKQRFYFAVPKKGDSRRKPSRLYTLSIMCFRAKPNVNMSENTK